MVELEDSLSERSN